MIFLNWKLFFFPAQGINWWFLIWPAEILSIVDGSYKQQISIGWDNGLAPISAYVTILYHELVIMW